MQTEADPLDPDPRGALRSEGLLYLEQAVTTIDWGEGLALRYGGFYGPVLEPLQRRAAGRRLKKTCTR